MLPDCLNGKTPKSQTDLPSQKGSFLGSIGAPEKLPNHTGLGVSTFLLYIHQKISNKSVIVILSINY